MIDVGAVPACHCDTMLEVMAKAISEQPEGDDRSIWAPHDNPYLTAHVEDVSQRLIAILQLIQTTFARIVSGESISTLMKAAVPWLRWEPEKFAAVRRDLETKQSAIWTLDDWLLLAEYLVQRYLPDGVIETEAEYLTVRATMLGRIQAAQATPGVPSPDVLAAWSTLTPTTFATVPPRLLAPVELSVMAFAKARAATHIGAVTEAVRNTMRSLVIDHVQAMVLGQRQGDVAALQTRLFDQFAVLNRDMRRIAVTEAGECMCQGFIAAQKPGDKVKRMEAYRGACKFCKSIDGRVFDVIAADTPDKVKEEQAQTAIWTGKTNVGRSASSRRREGNALVSRNDNERWWPAAGVQHPHCRGRWVAVPGAAPPNLSPKFVSYLETIMAEHRAKVAAPRVEKELKA